MALPATVNAGAEAGFTADDINRMSKLPRIDIIDKFGQAISAIDQEARLNTSFLHLDADPVVGWRSCTVWDDCGGS